MAYQTKRGNDRYKDEPFVTLVRVSDAANKQDSDDAQLLYLKECGTNFGMVWVEDFVENDLSGSLPGNRHDITALLQRADEKKDFKYVLAQRIDRATRGGAQHLFWLEFELKKRGIRVLYPGDGLPDGVPFEGSLRAFKADAAKDQAIGTSQRSAQGRQYALEQRRVSPHSHTPFGTYRLYCRTETEPLHIIKDLRNGLQQKLSWPDQKLIDTYGMIGGGSEGHYKKQKWEMVFLLPGDPLEHELVIELFRLHYIEGFGGRAIASMLNTRGTRAPMGGKWAPRQVESIYENEDYTGLAIANRMSAAFYHQCQHGQPKRVEMDDQTATIAERVKAIVRPEEEWHRDDEPYLYDFLRDENLRQIAIAQQKLKWSRRLDPTWERPNKAKRPKSPYLLHPLLVAKQDGESLVGTIIGRENAPKRVYRHKGAVRECQPGNILARTIPADPLEKALLAVLQQILLDWPELEPRLLEHVERQKVLRDQSDGLIAQKQEKRDQVKEQLLLFARMLSPKTKDDLAPEIARLEAQRDVLDQELDMLRKTRGAAAIDANAVVSTIKHRLQSLAEEVALLPPNLVKQVLAAITKSLVVDMETREVEFEFHLPQWTEWEAIGAGVSMMCLRTSRELSVEARTHRDEALFTPLGFGKCEFKKEHRGVSCECRRLRKAA